MVGESSESSPLVAPTQMAKPSEIDLEVGPDEQIQCRICLETDGRDFIVPCKCKGTSKFVHRECLDHWRAVKEGFAFAHCTTCKAPYYIRVQGTADRKWRTLKFRFFVTRDILFIFFSVQLVIALLAYLVYVIDRYQKFWLRLLWGFDSGLSFYYICGKHFGLQCSCKQCPLHLANAPLVLSLPQNMSFSFISLMIAHNKCSEVAPHFVYLLSNSSYVIEEEPVSSLCHT